MVEAAEAIVRTLVGAKPLRVRLEAGELARIEVPRSCLAQLVTPEACDLLTAELTQLGFRAVTVDLEGFRSGNLNALVPLEMRSTLARRQFVPQTGE